MTIQLLVLLAACMSFTGCSSPDHEALYRSGISFETFMDRVDRRGRRGGPSSRRFAVRA